MPDATVLPHHRLFEPRGGERVLTELATLFPQPAILRAFIEQSPYGWPEALAARRRGPADRSRCIGPRGRGRRWQVAECFAADRFARGMIATYEP